MKIAICRTAMALMCPSSIAHADAAQWYIRLTLCKESCIEKYLPVDPEVNEVQCKLGAGMTGFAWAQENFPAWRLTQVDCVDHVSADL